MLILQMKILHQEKDKEEMYNCTGINISKWKYINEKKKEWYKDGHGLGPVLLLTLT